MKTPEEVINKWSFYGRIPTKELEAILKEWQKEAWNEAIISASQAGFGFAYNGHILIRKDDILKLLK